MTDKKNPDYFIQEAAKTVAQRGKENGYDKDEERSARSVAVMFNEMHPGFNLTEDHIWDIMLCLKLKRNANQPREDNIIDLIGYASLRGESQSAPNKVKPSLHEKRGPSMDKENIQAPRNGLWLLGNNYLLKDIPILDVVEKEDRYEVISRASSISVAYSKHQYRLKDYGPVKKGWWLEPKFGGIGAIPVKVADCYPHNIAETSDSFLFNGRYFLKSRWKLREC